MLEQQKMQYLLIIKATQTPYCQSQLLLKVSKIKVNLYMWALVIPSQLAEIIDLFS